MQESQVYLKLCQNGLLGWGCTHLKFIIALVTNAVSGRLRLPLKPGWFVWAVGIVFEEVELRHPLAASCKFGVDAWPTVQWLALRSRACPAFKKGRASCRYFAVPGLYEIVEVGTLKLHVGPPMSKWFCLRSRFLDSSSLERIEPASPLKLYLMFASDK